MEAVDTSSQPDCPDAFLSYVREDQAFVQDLVAALEGAGKSVWVDWEDIGTSANWCGQVERGIESAKTVVPVLSPDFAQSDVAAEEIALATTHNKRLIPVVRRNLDGEALAPVLRAPNWIFARETDDVRRAVREVVEAIELDFDWLGRHARLLERAAEWHRANRDASLVLRGGDLRRAEELLARQGEHREEPTALQVEYVANSRRASARRQRALLGSAAALLVMAVLTVRSVRSS